MKMKLNNQMVLSLFNRLAPYNPKDEKEETAKPKEVTLKNDDDEETY